VEFHILALLDTLVDAQWQRLLVAIVGVWHIHQRKVTYSSVRKPHQVSDESLALAKELLANLKERSQIPVSDPATVITMSDQSVHTLTGEWSIKSYELIY